MSNARARAEGLPPPEPMLPPPGPVGRGLAWASRILGAAGSLMIVGLMVAINADVGGRYLFNHPVPGTAELVAAAIVSIIFLQLPDTVRTDRMIRSDMFIGRIARARPALGRMLEFLFALAGTLMLATLVRYVAPTALRAFRDDHEIGIPGVFTAPLWPFHALVVLGAALATAEYARTALGHLRLLIGKHP